MSATVPTAYPFPFSNGGGIRHSNATRPLRGPQSQYVRQPYLGSPPSISAASGLGSGGGASIVNNGSDADQSQGLVAARIGVGPASAGVLVLSFPVASPVGGYWLAADWATLVQSEAADVLTINWTATRPLIPGELVTLAYQWTISQ